MAKAQKTTPRVEATVVLTLSEEEATLLRDVLGSVMGPSQSRGKYSDAVYSALVSVIGSNFDSREFRDFTGNIRFAAPNGR